MDLKDVIHENGRYWVYQQKEIFYVMITGLAGSASESVYCDQELAVARCDYLASRKEEPR